MAVPLTTFGNIDQLVILANDKCPNDQFKIQLATSKDYFTSLDDKLPTRKVSFNHYDEMVNKLHNTDFHNNRVDYWTGYWDNLPWLKVLITQAFDVFTISSTFDHLLTDHKNDKADDTFWSAAAQNISFGAHHDSIPGVSKAYVHAEERVKYSGTIQQMQEKLMNSLIRFMGFTFYPSYLDEYHPHRYHYILYHNSLDKVTRTVKFNLHFDAKFVSDWRSMKA